jgi:putative Holliday junction resolvase
LRVLAVDFGLARVGLAVSDPAGRMAFPLATLTRTTRDKLFADILAVIEREGVERVVVGLPLSLDGSESESTRRARNFAASLARRTDRPVVLEDERLSTDAALEDLRAAGVRGKRKQAAVDQQAAVRILQTHLARA